MRARTETELREIVRGEFDSFLRVVRERIEMAHVHGYEPNLGGTLIESYVDETFGRIEQLLKTEEGL